MLDPWVYLIKRSSSPLFSELEKLVSSSDCDVVSVSRRGVEEDDTTVTVTTGNLLNDDVEAARTWYRDEVRSYVDPCYNHITVIVHL